MIRTPHARVLPFETLALLAKNEDGGIDSDRAKELIKIFRPERDGSLGKLEFVKSIDQVRFCYIVLAMHARFRVVMTLCSQSLRMLMFQLCIPFSRFISSCGF